VYASANQTNVVVPYGIALYQKGDPVPVQVSFNGMKTAAVVVADVNVPGFFTAGANGTGQVLVANQDGTLNSPSNPAPRGSIVTFYATGEGQLSPPGIDGQITVLPLPAATQPVSVRIGGKPADLRYAGPAPAEVSGVMQINATVPLDAPTGNDSVYLVIGANITPPGLTLVVR
jgi:uncharacterized protein (TIGR03437 family)